MAEAPAPAPPTGVPQHKPYAPTTAALGGLPTVGLDVPITEAFLFLYMISAAIHMAIFQINKRQGHKFLISGALFGFSMSRIVTCVLRIAWTTRVRHVPLAIGAQVFVAAGVLLVFVINIIFTQRIIRAVHPRFGWNRLARLMLQAYWVTIVLSLVMLITCTTQSFYTLNANTKRIDRDVQLYGSTWFAVTAFLPLPLLAATFVIPHRNRIEPFGSGRLLTKVLVLLAGATVLTLGAAFRAGTLYTAPRPSTNPAWYHSKACFYGFDFTTEIIVLYLYAIARVDRLFFVPNGCKGPGDYSAGTIKRESANGFRTSRDEEEVYEDVPESRAGDLKEKEKEDHMVDEEPGLPGSSHR